MKKQYSGKQIFMMTMLVIGGLSYFMIFCGIIDDGYDDVYMDDDYDDYRYEHDDDYRDGVDDAIDEMGDDW